MDKAILFHSADEIFIIRFQKKMFEEIGRKGICVSPFFPVFCPLGGFEYNDEKIVLENPRIMPDGIYIPVSLFRNGNGEKCSFMMKIAVFLGENKKEVLSDSAINSEDFLFPRALKRFRIAEYEKTGFETKFYNEKWFKI